MWSKEEQHRNWREHEEMRRRDEETRMASAFKEMERLRQEELASMIERNRQEELAAAERLAQREELAAAERLAQREELASRRARAVAEESERHEAQLRWTMELGQGRDWGGGVFTDHSSL
jgi:hypothetical protein